ncbi:MAG: FAD-binding protein [Geminicoccaceae bacterium]
MRTRWRPPSPASTNLRARARTPSSTRARRPTTARSAIPSTAPIPASPLDQPPFLCRQGRRRRPRHLRRPALQRTRPVLDENSRPIDGLYAAGNDAASIMGGNYPGGGITLGPALVFGHIAARHMAGVDEPE